MASFSIGTHLSPLNPIRNRCLAYLLHNHNHSVHFLPSSGFSSFRFRGKKLLGNGVLARAEDKARGSPPSLDQQPEPNSEKQFQKKKKVRSRQKKLKAFDLSNLSEFLPNLNGSDQPTTPSPTEFKINCKTRQTLILKEGKQLSTVLNHPAFQADPLGSIFQHLQGTQPVFEEKLKKKTGKNGGKKKKGKKSKASSSEPQSMDM